MYYVINHKCLVILDNTTMFDRIKFITYKFFHAKILLVLGSILCKVALETNSIILEQGFQI